MFGLDPSPEDTVQMVVDAYRRVYVANRGKYLRVSEMRDAIKNELHRHTNCHIRYPDDPQPSLEETLVELPEFIHMVVMHNVGVCIIDSHRVTEEQLLEIRRQIEQADIPVGLVITVDGPIPTCERIDADIPLWQRQVMESISWDEE